jgi:hypothetical protein
MGFGFGHDLGMGFGLFGGFSIFSSLIFLLVIGVFIFVLVKGIGQWSRNNNSPRLTVDATVAAKRQHTSHHHGTDMHMHHSSSSYYVTFQVSSGDRMELWVPGNQYGLLIEGDQGKLTFQGTRFLSFERV